MTDIPEDILAIADDIRHQGPTQDRIARAILAERKRCADAVINHCSYGHYMSEGTALAALAEIDPHSAELHRGNVERFRAMLRETPPPTVHVGAST